MSACALARPIQVSPSSYAYEAHALSDLRAILEPEVQICWWPRTPKPGLKAELDSARFAPRPVLDQVVQADDRPNLDIPDALAADVASLMTFYRDLLGCPTIALRLNAIDKTMCPRFHVDRTGIRLICTYRGPGTLWFDDAAIDRSQLQDITEEHPAVAQVPTFAIALLKGAAWPGNEEHGAIHRSPPVPPGVTRVLLTLDALWPSL